MKTEKFKDTWIEIMGCTIRPWSYGDKLVIDLPYGGGYPAYIGPDGRPTSGNDKLFDSLEEAEEALMLYLLHRGSI